MSYCVKVGVVLIQSAATDMVLSFVVPMYAMYGIPCRITSGVEGRHMIGSKHYTAQSLDFSVAVIAKEAQEVFCSKLRDAAGTVLDVVLEADHIHVEMK